MAQPGSQGVDIKSTDKKDEVVAPTPHNTPIVTAPVQNLTQASKMASGSFAPNAQLVNDLQGRLGSLIGGSSGYVESLPAEVQRRLNGLKGLQAKHAKLETKFHMEIFELEKKFLALYRPLYEKRSQIVTGQAEPTAEEVEAGKKAEDKDGAEASTPATKVDDDHEPLTGIPEFWLTCMKNHPQLDEMITERDQEALKHLTNIGLEYLDDTHAFRLNFEFAANDYFTNKVLTKTYHYQTNADIGDIVFHRAEGDTIQWKDGKDLTVALESRKQRNKATNETRVVKKSVPTDSFFLFFRNSDVPDESVDDEVAAELQEQVEADYEIGEEFKEKIIPHAVDWFTGRALEYEGFDMEDFEDDGEDFYGEDSEDEDDDDFEDDEEDRKVRL